MNILFTNVGRRTYLVESALVLKKQGIIDNVYVSDTSEDTAGFHISDEIKYFITPRVSGNEKKYIETLLTNCKEKNVNVIVPLMDFELLILSQNKQKFEEIDCKVIVSSEQVISNTLNKKDNYKYNIENNILTPKSYFSVNDISDKEPFVRKEIVGSGSVGLSFHKDKASLTDFREGIEMLQEMVEGQEYGIDILNDLEGNFVHTCCKKKIGMRAGETDKAAVIYNDMLADFARDVSQKYKHIGNMDVDVLVDKNNKIWCIDMNPRFGGGYPFTYYAGFDYLLYIVKMIKGEKIDIPESQKQIVGMKGVKLYYYEK